MEASILAAPGAELQARLSEKLRFLPSAKIRGMAPAGAKTLSGVPIRLDYASKSEWLRALRQTVQCFSKAQKSEDSLKEEETYVVWVNTWLELSGHGTFVQIDRNVSGQFMASWHGMCAWCERCSGYSGRAANAARSEMRRRLLSVLS